jgi:hypothetical protein
MRKSMLLSALILSTALTLPAVAQSSDAPAPASTASKGQMLHAADGARVALVDRVDTDGSVEVIYYGRVVTVPVSSLTVKDGELTTSFTKAELTVAK